MEEKGKSKEEKGKNNGEWKNKKKQRGLSTTPEAQFSAVQIPFPLAVLLTGI